MMEADKQEPIAIIGAACRLPGQVSDLGSLWDMISNVKTGHCKVPEDRWDADKLQHPDPDRKGTMAVKHGYFLQQDISHFDAPFFSTTAKEAAAMDPMKRLLLEVSYESLENAGIPMETLPNSQTGCYVGCMTNDYEMLSTHDIQDIGYSAATGLSEAMTSNRVSWFFGLRGPSLTLDTACSSSLYALHLACQSLKLGESDQALVAGVNLILYPNCMEQFSGIHMLSPEGISHSFDDRANGYGRGEGIGCLVVKRLSDALRDGDTIRAVVRNTGVNADGKTPSITQPSSEAQAELIRKTYEKAGLPLTSTEYFESHGTGTPVGDPIELSAIGSTLGAARAAEGLGPLYVGSVKPSVGHTEGCSGLASVFKAILSLEKGMIVPTYGVENLNPKLTLDDWNIRLPLGTIPWPSSQARRISVNSFGFGGANAHVILDDAHNYLKDRGLVGNHSTAVLDYESSESGVDVGTSTPASSRGEDGDAPDAKQLFVFSSRDQAGIQRLANVFHDRLIQIGAAGIAKDDPRFVSSLAYTLAVRRSHHDFRSFAVASSLGELSTELSKPHSKSKRSSHRQRDRNLVFVFTGQGAQWASMGTQLCGHPVFERSVRASQEYLKAHGCKWDALDELRKTEDEGSKIALPEYSQTLCTVLQVALVDLLRHWNILPKATVGHSSGEIAAAYAASYISHSDAVKIAYVRGISSAQVARDGAMMAAGLSNAEAQEYLSKIPKGSAVVACVNSPSSVTLSGDTEAIDALEKTIAADNKFARKLKVKTAYHSPHMRNVSQSYLERLGTIQTQSPTGGTIMFSSLTGKVVSPETLTAEYWVNNMCNPVQFSDAVSALLASTSTSQATSGNRERVIQNRWEGFLEIGPHAALQGPVQQTIQAAANQSAKDAPYLSVLLRGKDGNTTALTAAGKLWAVGFDVDLAAVNGVVFDTLAMPKVLTDLPTYPWNHNRNFWHEAYASKSVRFPVAPRTDLLGMPEDAQNQWEPRWKNYLRINENPWIEDHMITGTILYPAAGMLVMALEGATQAADTSKNIGGFRFRNVSFERGLVVTSGDEAAVQTQLSLLPVQGVDDQFQFTVYSTTTGTSWTKHCSGTVCLEYPLEDDNVDGTTADVAWTEQFDEYKRLSGDDDAEPLDIDEFYDGLESKGMEYGALFRNVVSLASIGSRKAIHGAVQIPDTKSVMPAEFEYPHVIHPATMDSIFHLLLATVNDGRPTQEAAVPYHLDDLFVSAEQPEGAGTLFYGYSRLTSKTKSGREVTGELVVSDEAFSSPKIVAKGFALRQVTSGADAGGANGEDSNKVKKSAVVEWKEDLDFIQSADQFAKLARDEDELLAWLDKLTHKKIIRQILVVADGDGKHSSDILNAVNERLGRRPGFGRATALVTTATAADGLLSRWPHTFDGVKVLDTTTGEEFPYTDTSFDLVLALSSGEIEGQPQLLSKLHEKLAVEGQLVIRSSQRKPENIKMDIEGPGTDCIVVSDSSHLIASKTRGQITELPSEVCFLLSGAPSIDLEVLQRTMTSRFNALGISVQTTTLTPDDVAELAGKHVISFLEIESPVIRYWGESQLDAFKALVSTASHVFWITRGSLLESWSAGVDFSPAQGLLRVMRNEYSLTTLPHLDLSASFSPVAPNSASLIFGVWKASLTDSAEMEYAEYQGAVHIPRAVEYASLDGDLQLANGTAMPVRRPVRVSGKVMELSSVVDGGHFLWTENAEADPLTLAPNHVEVEVAFIGLASTGFLGHADQDEVPLPRKSCEAVGLVTRCGDKVTSVMPGQRVVVFNTAACKTHICQHESLVTLAPDNLQSEEVVVMPRVFVAARYALAHTADVGPGQSVLIHNTASALGQAALQVAKASEAEIFALVDTKAEKGMILERYGIPESRVFDSRGHKFPAAIEAATEGRGVDAIVAGEPGTAVQQSLNSLGDFGYFFDFGASGHGAPILTLPTSKRNASLIRIDVDSLLQTKERVVQKMFRSTFTEELTAIHPIRVFPVSEAKQAVDMLNSKQSAAIALSIGTNDTVLTMPPPAEELSLDGDGSYVLAGGLGALGLNIASMMIEHGAKRLVFLSRSGGAKNQKELDEFRCRGVDAVALKCDVNNAASVARAFLHLRNIGRSVKGIVQCAMVLEDTIFDNMDYEKWSRAFTPKTSGSRNLLAQLSPGDEAFFILLSSITGIIGNTAQANYASGNTFEDALANYARDHGNIRATSIDVGLVADSSHFTASGGFGELKNYLTRYQHGWIGLQCSMDELMTALQAVMRGSTADGSNVPSQFVLGLGDSIVRSSKTSSSFARDRKFDMRVVNESNSSGDGTPDKGVDIGESLRQATSLSEAAAAVELVFKTQIAAAFGVDTEEVDSQKPLPELGVDSLKGVEMRNRALKDMQSDISVFELLNATPLADIAAKIASRSALVKVDESTTEGN